MERRPAPGNTKKKYKSIIIIKLKNTWLEIVESQRIICYSEQGYPAQ